MYQLIKALFALDFSHNLAFKGGTLAYFLYELDRFSTDIDIDCLAGLPNESQSLQIQDIIAKQGTIKDFQKFQHMHRYIMSYATQDHNIKIELNARIWEANTYEIASFFGSPIQIMDQATIFANKLVAIMDRKSPTSRDIWDVYFFSTHHFPINEGVIIERTEMSPKLFFETLKQYIQQYFSGSKIVDANLGLVLDNAQKHRARKFLVQEVSNFLDLQIFELSKK